VMRSIAHYGLDISRAAFMTGKSPYPYLPAFNTSLFLSANEEDVKSAIAANYPAGLVLPSKIVDEDDDVELRVAFDFDGVIADDEAETVFKKNNDLDEFHAHEALHVATPHQPGPLADMFQKLALMQRITESLKDFLARHETSFHLERFRTGWSTLSGVLAKRIESEEMTLYPLYERRVMNRPERRGDSGER